MSVPTRGRRRLGVPWLMAGLLAGCAHRPPPPVAAPAANPAAPVVGPRQVTGTYLLTTDLKLSRPAAAQPSRRQRRPPPAPVASLRLDFQPLAAPDPTAGSSTQLAATVNIPGYTSAPRGRAGQAAAWWPLPGDSVIVHFGTPRGDGQMDLRGILQADTLSGEIWYTSSSSGTVFQMGTFRGVKQKR